MTGSVMKKTSFFLPLMLLASVCTIALNAQSEVEKIQAENEANGLRYHVSEESRGLLKRMDQQYCFFKILSGGKYPYLLSFHPGKNEIKNVLCGFENEKTGDIELIKEAAQIKNLKPIRAFTLMMDGNLKMDEKYRQEFLRATCLCLELAYKFFRHSLWRLHSSKFVSE